MVPTPIAKATVTVSTPAAALTAGYLGTRKGYPDTAFQLGNNAVGGIQGGNSPPYPPEPGAGTQSAAETVG